MGYFSLNTNTGLVVSHNVGLFTGGSGNNPPIYGQVVVPSGTNGYWMSNYYWVALNPPLLLNSNAVYTVVGLAGNGDGDAWHDLENPGWYPVFVGGTGTTSGGFGIYGPGTATWPPTSTGNNGANNAYGAPNLANIPIGPASAGVQSTSIAISAGQTLSVIGFGTGQPPIAYQWYEGTTNNPLATQTSATLTIPNAATNNSGTYFMIASNSLGSGQTSNVVVTITAVPVSITKQPTNQTTVFCQLSGEFFHHCPSGTFPPISYQWFRNGAAIPRRPRHHLFVIHQLTTMAMSIPVWCRTISRPLLKPRPAAMRLWPSPIIWPIRRSFCMVLIRP